MRRFAILLIVMASTLACSGQEGGRPAPATKEESPGGMIEPMVYVWCSTIDDKCEENVTGKRVNRDAMAVLREVYGRKMRPANAMLDNQGGPTLFLYQVDGADVLAPILRGANVLSLKFIIDDDSGEPGFMADEALFIPSDLDRDAMKAPVEAFLARNLIPPAGRTHVDRHRSKIVSAKAAK